MANYANHLKPVKANQTTKDRVDQVKNNAGGYVYQLSELDQLDRFLILGTEGGGYYASEAKMTIGNAKVVQNLLAAGRGREVVDRVVEISDKGRAVKNDPALFVLAMVSAYGQDADKAYVADALPKVARTATMLFTFVDYANGLRRWGRSLRRAVSNWYNTQEAGKLAYQVCKYQSRTKEGSQTWSHKDLLRKAHVTPASSLHGEVLRYVTKGWSEDQILAVKPGRENPFTYIWAHEMAKKATSADTINTLIREHGLVRESIPTQYLNDIKVWDALLDKMPYTAMIRNLATMTRNGLVNDNGALSKGPNGNARVIEKLLDGESLRKARVHPLTVLQALRTYQSGRGFKGTNTWTPVSRITDALDKAFYLAFDQIAPLGKRVLLAVDCSGSMSSPVHGMENISSRDAAAAMALVIAKHSPNHAIMGFGSGSGRAGGYGYSRNVGLSGIDHLKITPDMRLDKVAEVMARFPWGGTDCALPMLYAKANNLEVDAFVVITDNETWAGSVKADEALRQYRQSSGISDARLIVVGTEASPFTIGDPKDKYTLNIAGFDTAAPTLITDFIRGDI